MQWKWGRNKQSNKISWRPWTGKAESVERDEGKDEETAWRQGRVVWIRYRRKWRADSLIMPEEHQDSGYKIPKQPGIKEGRKRVVRDFRFIGLKQVYFSFPVLLNNSSFHMAKITNWFSTDIHVQILVVSCSEQWQLDDGLKHFNQNNKINK